MTFFAFRKGNQGLRGQHQMKLELFVFKYKNILKNKKAQLNNRVGDFNTPLTTMDRTTN